MNGRLVFITCPPAKPEALRLPAPVMGLFAIEDQKLDTRTLPQNRGGGLVPFGGSGSLGKRMFIGALLALVWNFLQQAMMNLAPCAACRCCSPACCRLPS